MLKTLDFDAPYDSIVTESKGMLKTPDFDANQSNLLMNVVIIYKYGNDSASLHLLIKIGFLDFKACNFTIFCTRIHSRSQRAEKHILGASQATSFI